MKQSPLSFSHIHLKLSLKCWLYLWLGCLSEVDECKHCTGCPFKVTLVTCGSYLGVFFFFVFFNYILLSLSFHSALTFWLTFFFFPSAPSLSLFSFSFFSCLFFFHLISLLFSQSNSSTLFS